MPAARSINASKIVDLRAADVTGVIIGWSVGFDGAIVVLTCKGAPEYLRRNEFTIHVIRDERRERIRMPETPETFVMPRGLPEDQVLLIRDRPATGGPKGVVVDRAGNEVRRVELGSSLENVIVDADGTIYALSVPRPTDCT